MFVSNYPNPVCSNIPLSIYYADAGLQHCFIRHVVRMVNYFYLSQINTTGRSFYETRKKTDLLPFLASIWLTNPGEKNDKINYESNNVSSFLFLCWLADCLNSDPEISSSSK